MKIRNIKLLLFGRGISLLAEMVYLIILPLYIFTSTKSLKDSSIFFAFSTLPAILLTPFIGSYVEDKNKKYIIVLCDVLNSFLFFFIFLFYENKNFLIFLFFINTISIFISKIFSISSKVLFSELLSEDDLEKYNSIQSIIENAIIIIGPVLGTLFYNLYGFKIIILYLAISYFLSSIQEFFIEYNKKLEKGNKENFISSFLEGFKYIKNNNNLVGFFILVMSLNFFIANNDEIINPGILIEKFRISEQYLGFSAGILGFGSILGSFVIIITKKINFFKNIKYLFILNSFFMISIGFFSLILIGKNKVIFYLIFLVLQFLIGITTTLINVPLISNFQKEVKIEYQSRFFSILSFFSGLLIPLGILYTGYLSSIFGADIMYILNNLCIIFIVFYTYKRYI